MAVARKGAPDRATNPLRALSAWEYAAPFPITTSGLQSKPTLDALFLQVLGYQTAKKLST